MRVGLLGVFALALTAAGCAGSGPFPSSLLPPDSAAANSSKKDNVALAGPTTAAQQPADTKLSYGCTSYDNLTPPCMSTWPAGSPNYHGPIPGPTFYDEH